MTDNFIDLSPMYHLNNMGELATNRDILISEHGDIETFTPAY